MALYQHIEKLLTGMGVPFADMGNHQILVKIVTENYTNRVGEKAVSILLEPMPDRMLSIKAPLSYDIRQETAMEVGFAALSLHQFAPSVRFTMEGFEDVETPVLTAETFIPVFDSTLTAEQLEYYVFQLAADLDNLDPVIRKLIETGDLDLSLMPPMPGEELVTRDLDKIIPEEVLKDLQKLTGIVVDGHHKEAKSKDKKKK